MFIPFQAYMNREKDKEKLYYKFFRIPTLIQNIDLLNSIRCGNDYEIISMN